MLLMSHMYYEISIQTDPLAFDAIVGFLSDLSVEGFLEDEDSLKCYIKERYWNRECEERLQEYCSVLKKQGTVSEFTLKTSKIEDRDWNVEWVRTVQPVEISDRLVVKPSWHPEKSAWKDKLVLVIDPKMAFGTGYHESTRLALRLLEQHLKIGDAVLDVGTGTGILAIAAARLGASKVTAIDNDPWAYANATENVKGNAVSDRVTVRLRTLDALHSDQYDLLLVNITKSAILEHLQLLAAKLGSGGRLILSGLSGTDTEDVEGFLRSHGLKILQTMIENEWAGIATIKN